MYVLSAADQVWNRGLSDEPGTGVGDRHLWAMSGPYSQIMANGTSAVLDAYTPEQVLDAAAAFDYLGLHELADLTRRLAVVNGEGEQRRNHAFYSLELALESAFMRRYADSPEDFDPAPGPPSRFPESSGRVACTGEVIVHELTKQCSAGTDCAGPSVSVSVHPRVRLAAHDGCELCPSGADWAL